MTQAPSRQDEYTSHRAAVLSGSILDPEAAADSRVAPAALAFGATAELKVGAAPILTDEQVKAAFYQHFRDWRGEEFRSVSKNCVAVLGSGDDLIFVLRGRMSYFDVPVGADEQTVTILQLSGGPAHAVHGVASHVTEMDLGDRLLYGPMQTVRDLATRDEHGYAVQDLPIELGIDRLGNLLVRNTGRAHLFVAAERGALNTGAGKYLTSEQVFAHQTSQLASVLDYVAKGVRSGYPAAPLLADLRDHLQSSTEAPERPISFKAYYSFTEPARWVGNEGPGTRMDAWNFFLRKVGHTDWKGAVGRATNDILRNGTKRETGSGSVEFDTGIAGVKLQLDYHHEGTEITSFTPRITIDPTQQIPVRPEPTRQQVERREARQQSGQDVVKASPWQPGAQRPLLDRVRAVQQTSATQQREQSGR